MREAPDSLSTITTQSGLISLSHFVLDKNLKSQLLYPPQNPIHQTKWVPGNPTEALEQATDDCNKSVG